MCQSRSSRRGTTVYPERSGLNQGGGYGVVMRIRLLLALGWVLVASCSDGTLSGNTGGAGGTTDGATPEGETVSVVSVFDGDSMLVEITAGEREVRLAGVNAPETGECFAAEAEQRLVELAGDEVTLVSVPGEDDEDQFGRLLRDVWAGGVWLNRTFAAEGTAMVLHTSRVGQEELSAAGDSAWEDRLGMWGTTCGPAPEGVEIADIVFDPPGADDEVSNDEYVVVENTTAGPIDVSGWIVRDESSIHRYVFEDGAVLDPGTPVIIRSGCGDGTPTDRHWCADGSVWSNGGDTVLLQTPTGTVVARRAYPG